MLTRQHQVLAKLVKSRQVQSRELKQRVRQVEVAQAHADQERLLGRGDAAKQFEAEEALRRVRAKTTLSFAA